MAHTKLRYHMVTATKGRQPFLTPEVEEVAYPVLRNEAKQLGGKIFYIGGVEDHVHMISTVPPVMALSDFIGGIKCECTKAIKREFPHLDNFEWQVSFSAFTLNPSDMGRIINYVLNQKERHEKDDLVARYERSS
jgi:REP element-mobilizing transposase RayT